MSLAYFLYNLLCTIKRQVVSLSPRLFLALHVYKPSSSGYTSLIDRVAVPFRYLRSKISEELSNYSKRIWCNRRRVLMTFWFHKPACGRHEIHIPTEMTLKYGNFNLITSPFFIHVTLGSGSPLTIHVSFIASPSLIVMSLRGFTNCGWHMSESDGGTVIQNNKRSLKRI